MEKEIAHGNLPFERKNKKLIKEQVEAMDKVQWRSRDYHCVLREFIALFPAGERELTIAMEKLEEAAMWARKGISN